MPLDIKIIDGIETFNVNDAVQGSHAISIDNIKEYIQNGITVPTPQISIAGDMIDRNGNISFVAKYNSSDRRILDYEPEIYLYMKKKRRGTNSAIYDNMGNFIGNKHNIRYKHKLCHMNQSDGMTLTSLKKDVNPRLNAYHGRNVNTEWLVDGTQTDMTTQFVVNPFQFLGNLSFGDAGTGIFPMLKANWNKIGTGTTFPATFTTKAIGRQTDGQGRPLTHITLYFKTVIRNPNGGHPIESVESYPIVIYPDVNRLTGTPDQYSHRGVNINYNTR